MKLDITREGSLITRDRFCGHVFNLSPKGFKIKKNVFVFGLEERLYLLYTYLHIPSIEIIYHFSVFRSQVKLVLI